MPIATAASAETSAGEATTAASGSIVKASADPARRAEVEQRPPSRRRGTGRPHPPADDSTAPSISSWRMIRARLAPSARPHRDLALPRVGAREQEVGDVRRRDHEDQPDDEHQQPERTIEIVRPATCRRRGPNWSGSDHTVPPRARGRASPRVICACACSTATPGRVRPTSDIQLDSRLPNTIVGPRDRRVKLLADRHPDVDAPAAGEAAERRRRDADARVGGAGRSPGASLLMTLPVAAEHRLPEPRTDHRHRRGAVAARRRRRSPGPSGRSTPRSGK